MRREGGTAWIRKPWSASVILVQEKAGGTAPYTAIFSVKPTIDEIASS